MHAPHRSWLLALIALAVLFILPATASAADLHATPATFSSVFAGAQGGDRVLLASGNYGNWGGGAKPAPGVTIAPETGAAPTFSGGTFGSSVRNITIQGITYTGPVDVGPGSTPLNLIFDGDTWGNVGQGAHEGRLSIAGGGSNAIGSNGVQVKNSTFGPGGCSDGIQDSSKGTEIGPGNEFKNITQSCSASTAHVDSIQVYASNYVWIHDNYIHDGEQGIMSPDGPSTGYRIENNVIHTSTGYPCMHIGDNRDSTISHNVCRNGAIRLYEGNQGVASQNITAQNNVAAIDNSACSGCTVDHNVSPGASASWAASAAAPTPSSRRDRQRRHPYRPQRLRRWTAGARPPPTNPPPTNPPPTNPPPTNPPPTNPPPTNPTTHEPAADHEQHADGPLHVLAGQPGHRAGRDLRRGRLDVRRHAVHLHVGRRRLRRPRRRAVAAGQRAHALVHLPRSRRQERPPDRRRRRRRHRHDARPDHRDDGADHAAADQPAADQPAAHEPAADQPAADQPAAGERHTRRPTRRSSPGPAARRPTRRRRSPSPPRRATRPSSARSTPARGSTARARGARPP